VQINDDDDDDDKVAAVMGIKTPETKKQLRIFLLVQRLSSGLRAAC